MAKRHDLASSFDELIETWGTRNILLIDKVFAWEALEILENLWPERIENFINTGIRGGMQLAELIDAALVIKESREIKGFENVLKELRAGKSSSFRELVAAVLMKKANFDVEIEPQLNHKKPDIGFKFEGEMIYAEIFTPNESEFREEIHKYLNVLGYNLWTKKRHSAIEVILLGEPDPELLGHMTYLDDSIDKNPLFGTTYSFNNRIEWRYYAPISPTNEVPTRKYNQYRTQTNLTVSFVEPSKGTHVEVSYYINEQERIGKLVKKELKHFPHDTVNIIIFDSKRDAQDSSKIKEAISRRLNPNVNTRLSGALILSEYYTIIGGIKMQREWKYVSNPYASKPVPKNLENALSQLNKYQLW